MTETKSVEPSKEVAVFKGQISKIESRATEVSIQTQEDYVATTDLLSELKAVGSKITARKEEITKPLNQALKSARELFRPVEDQFARAEGVIKTKLLDYKRMKDEEARKEEARIAARVEKGTMRLDTAEKKLDAVEKVSTTTKGNVGEVQIRKVKKFRIVDEAALPRQYLVPDLVAIRQDAVIKGIAIPGVEVYEEEQVAAR